LRCIQYTEGLQEVVLLIIKSLAVKTFDDVFKSFDEMRNRMEKEFEEGFKQFKSNTPKDLVWEYETPEGTKVREYGPFVYGYSMTVGPNGRYMMVVVWALF
jgi:hypothetical protein